DAVDGAPGRPLALGGPGGQRARDLLDQLREARLVALEAPDLAPPAGDLLAQPRDHRGPLGALALERPRLRGGVRFVAGELVEARSASGGERRDLLAAAAKPRDQLGARALDV